MPALFILAIVSLLAALAAVVWRRVAPPVRRGSRWPAAAAFVLAVALLLGACFKQVGTKEDGVELSFGKPVGHLSAGPHMTAPWVKVKEMDAAIQTDTFAGADCLQVRIANQQTGCAKISLQWRIRQGAVDELYQNYRSFDHVRDALVTRKLNVALNEALAKYNPLDQIQGGGQTLPQVAKRITRIMRREVGGRIEVLSTLLPLVTFDADTQSRVNQLQQQVALTRIAQQERTTNIAKAKANSALASSVQTNVLVSRCIDTLEQMVKLHETVPAGFSCWPGGSSFAGVIAGAH